jgi:hypothetical protein
MRCLLSAFFAVLLTLPAAAQSMTSQLQTCQAIGDAQQRLACFDRISRGLPGVPAAPAAPYAPAPYAAPRPAAPAVTPQTYANQFGEEDMGVVQPSHRLRSVISDIADYKLDMRGKFIVTLGNGQTWKQIDGDSTRAPMRISAKRVRIERALLGSYNLVFSDLKPEFKVTRIH